MEDVVEAGELVVLTGSPGTGKTTVARLLADEMSSSVHLHADDFWRFIRRGGIMPYLPGARRQNAVVMEVLAGAACGYAGGGFHVVVDGVVGPWFLDRFSRAAGEAGLGLHYVVLRADEETTVARGAGRGEGELTDPEVLRGMYAQFADLGPLEAHVLDNGGLDAVGTAAAVREGIAEGRFLLPASPDA
ncbi:AAA family ATPase [Actinomadura rugatobispora]|uniref:AAA family ATPase n=1 Tax=Actinomadura rugatobispora TaxID=1994 RepID=A0ABW1A308_9ACTN|nr:AAA family ATPase [Actinomadura rugatobispora]